MPDPVKLEATLAERVHAAYKAHCKTYHELSKAIEQIVGVGRLEDANVEHDSQYDNSVEVTLVGDEKLTADERDRIKALGFTSVHNDDRSLGYAALCQRLEAQVADLDSRLSLAVRAGETSVPRETALEAMRCYHDEQNCNHDSAEACLLAAASRERAR